jgi:hypothetical protein
VEKKVFVGLRVKRKKSSCPHIGNRESSTLFSRPPLSLSLSLSFSFSFSFSFCTFFLTSSFLVFFYFSFILDLIKQQRIHGLRIDHPDGLRNPKVSTLLLLHLLLSLLPPLLTFTLRVTSIACNKPQQKL